MRHQPIQRLLSIRFGHLLVALASLLGSQPALHAQQSLAAEQLTGLQLAYPGDASASVWNPSLLGVKTATGEILLSLPFNRSFSPEHGSYSLFARYGSYGIGVMGNNRDSSLGPLTGFYGSYGWPAIPGRFWIGGGIRVFNDRGIIKGGGITLSTTIHPSSALVASLTLSNPTATNDAEPGISFNAAYTLTNWLTLLATAHYDANDTLSGHLPLTTHIGFALQPGGGVALNAHYDINQKIIRLGAEFGFAGIGVGTGDDFPIRHGFDGGDAFLCYTLSSEDPHHYNNAGFGTVATISRGWVPERAYIPAGLHYNSGETDAQRSPDSYSAPCDSTAEKGLNSPAGLLRTIGEAGGAYSLLARILHRIAPDSSGLYGAIRSRFYSPRIPKGKLYRGDSLPLFSPQGYSIGVQSIDYSSYPEVSVIMQVADSAGRNVGGLGIGDFAFRDTAMKILSVKPADATLTVPVDIVMLIDCSGSMVQKIAAVRGNAEAFLRKMESRGANYRIGGVLYGSMIYDTIHPTANFATFRNFMKNAAAIGGDEISSLAIKAATEMSFRPNAQRIFILITDDWAVQENARLSEGDLTQLLWNSGARLYTIITPCKNNSALMTRLSLGGEYDIEKPFNAILDRIGSDITTIYQLTYKAPPRDTLATEPSESYVTLLGTVTDENGRGLQTDVRIEDATTLANVASVRSDTSGQYQIVLPGRGRYRITATRPDYIPTPQEVDASHIGRGAMLLQELHITSIDAAIANGTTFTLKNIFFDYDRSDLTPASLPELGKLAALLEEYPTVKVEIDAHTDALGSDDYNQTLSELRARSVMNYLVGKGIGSDRVNARGFGRSRPVATNDTDEGRALNRRVEFRLFR